MTITAVATAVQRALGGHAAIGLLAGALIYLIALSGSLIVIHDRLQRWEQPGVAETAVLAPAAAQAAMAAAVARDAGRPRNTHVYTRMPTADLPRAVVTTDHGAWYVDAAGAIVAREAPAWTAFVVALHECLHLPATWGLVLVGALGAVLIALVMTGVLAHPRIVRDAFRLRVRHAPQLARADWHNRLGVWTLPFLLAVALTGAFIGLGNVGFTVLARAYAHGSLERAYAPIFGAEARPDPTTAPLPDIAAALTWMRRHVPAASPTYVIAHDPGTRGQHVQIIAEHPRRLIYGETYGFDASGRPTGALGMADGALGKQAAASAYKLHFGNYGGLAIELAYMLFGFALCGITATGTTLWLEKRRRRGLGGVRLSAGWRVIVWGSPLLLVAALWLRAAAGPDAPLVALFWGGLAAGLAVAAARPAWVTGRGLRQALALALAATAAGHGLAAAGVWAIDVVVLLAAGAGLWLERRVGARAMRP